MRIFRINRKTGSELPNPIPACKDELPFEKLEKMVDIAGQQEDFCRLRLEWLRRWLQHERRKSKNSERTRKQASNFDALITSEDIWEAHNLLTEHFERFSASQGLTLYELVGQWYVDTLLRSGATWRELLAIRRRNQRDGARSWATIVQAKIWRRNKKEEDTDP